MIRVLEDAEATPKEWYSERAKMYQGLRTEDKAHKTSPDLNKDPDFEMPTLYEELFAMAEANMIQSDRALKYAPSPFKLHTKPIEY